MLRFAIITVILSISGISIASTYSCSCIGWMVDKKYHPCRNFTDSKITYKSGTKLKKIDKKELEKVVKKSRFKYFEKGAVYEPDTGWHCKKNK